MGFLSEFLKAVTTDPKKVSGGSTAFSRKMEAEIKQMEDEEIALRKQWDIWDQRYAKAQALEKQGKIDEAIELYRQNALENSDRPGDYSALSMIYSKRKDYAEAIKWCDVALRSAACMPECQQSARRNFRSRRKNLYEKLKERDAKERGEKPIMYAKDFPNAVQFDFIKTSSRGKAKYLGPSGEDFFGEQLALLKYEADGYFGLWSENDYWIEVTILLFWDVMFKSTKQSPSFEVNTPLDLFNDIFYERRKQAIERLYSELSDMDLAEVLRSSYMRHKGEHCRLINNWDKFSIGELLFSTRALTNEQVLKICKRILISISGNRRGLPDLFLSKENKPLFVEVKTTREKVSVDQLEWHEYLTSEVGVPVELFVIRAIKPKPDTQTE